MMMDEVLRMYGREHGTASGEMHRTPPDPSKAYYCTQTIAETEGHELRRNSVTGELFDRSAHGLRYVGRSCGDTVLDMERWRRWMSGYGII
jgi:hypothetical protein